MNYTRTTIAGQAVRDEIAAHRAAMARPSRYRPGTLDSESLCAHQREMANRGYRGAEIVQTIRGWSLRYDSGLQDWGLIERGLTSWGEAVAAAQRWQSQDPDRRYVTFTETVPT
jgi:hypothetical protein